MRYLLLVLLCAVLSGCGTNAPAGGTDNSGPDVNNDPCWCYTNAEVDTLLTYVVADWSNGWSYNQELGILLDVCQNSCCATCGTALIDYVYLDIPVW